MMPDHISTTPRQLVFACLLICTTMTLSKPAQATEPSTRSCPASTTRQLRITDTWHVEMEANGYRRKSTVKATYEVTVEQDPANDRNLQVTINKVDVLADVPAQGRTASYQSTSLPKSTDYNAYELARPASFLNQDLVFHFTLNGKIDKVTGIDEVRQALEAHYDEHLKGSEVDETTRKIQRDLLKASVLASRWQDTLLPNLSPELAKNGSHETPAQVQAMASVPSESWLRPIDLQVFEASRLEESPDGEQVLYRNLRLDPKALGSQKTSIGPSPWTYEPRELTGTTKVRIDSSGIVTALDRQLHVDLWSTLTIGTKNIPVEMSIDHQRQVEPITD